MDRIDSPETLHLVARGRLTRDDQRRGPYVYVPFEVPFACARIAVRYHYSDRISADRHEGGNVIDLGLFDPRGADFPGATGFRGWSGSRRQSFWIGLDTATPGYLPGRLPAGRYQVILGLYQIWEHGADYVVEFDALPGAEQVEPAAPQAALEQQGAAETAETGFWLRCDLQSHTEHSDAWGTLDELAARAHAAGLDVLAVTDHNTTSHHRAIRAYDGPLLLVAGQEATTYHGHMNIWGDVGWCDFRCSTPEQIAAVIGLAHQRGALCSINHPKVGGPAWEYPSSLPVDALEVWQGPWPHRNTESLALWDSLLQAGRRLPGVGGSDYHCPAAGDEAPFL
ncbi:MAG TPA: CehA/McbA family metallohydrolase, partial [Roseiflexaceae bacterium]|nr:CehA/McbA family metallohydrolase [Roseiflexaceae bacterium]